ncbi:hypothetical protein ACXU4B_09750 [Dyella soli]|uniref:Type II secretion system protein n=1 Tax=Dyella soli TaxID=522319 RepID=A0A4R0YQH1_9GAMM|nr:hypothetical protein [Dyella soli]TCI11217.1 hypothetical protein EZM97_20640 [Dyella soli]
MTARTGVRILAVAASIGMAAAILAGLLVLGSPMHQRALRLDSRRVSDLSVISLQITEYWSQHKALPPDLASLGMARNLTGDPVSGAAYEYAVIGAEKYRLCASFDAASEPSGRSSGAYIPAGSALRWDHPAGKHCYELGAKHGSAVAEQMTSMGP